MRRFSSDALAIATMVGATAVSVVATRALVAARSDGPPACLTSHSEMSIFRDGPRVEIHSSEGATDIVLLRERAEGEGQRRRRKRRRHRHPHASEHSRVLALNFEGCMERRLDAQMEEIELRIERELREAEAKLHRMEVRVRADSNR